MNKVFIQSNKRQMIGAKVAKYSILRNTKNPERFEVEILDLESNLKLLKQEGKPYTRGGRLAYWSSDDLQSFTPLRFLPPQVMKFKGRAIVIDPDVFVLVDINELFDLDINDKAIAVRPLTKSTNGLMSFATSVMLLDCARLEHWKWDEMIESVFSMKMDYVSWMNLHFERSETIFFLDEVWNSFDKLGPDTKILHNTMRITQPWKTGLDLEFVRKSPISMPLNISHFRPGSLKNYMKYIWDKKFNNRYIKHPDPKQEGLFFQLLKEALDNGMITYRELEREITDKHIRVDALDLIKSKAPAS